MQARRRRMTRCLRHGIVIGCDVPVHGAHAVGEARTHSPAPAYAWLAEDLAAERSCQLRLLWGPEAIGSAQVIWYRGACRYSCLCKHLLPGAVPSQPLRVGDRAAGPPRPLPAGGNSLPRASGGRFRRRDRNLSLPETQSALAAAENDGPGASVRADSRSPRTIRMPPKRRHLGAQRGTIPAMCLRSDDRSSLVHVNVLLRGARGFIFWETLFYWPNLFLDCPVDCQ